MSGPGVGFEYPPVEVKWLQRDVLLFASTIGATADELHFLYVCRRPVQKDLARIDKHQEFHPKFAVFPTYPILLPFKKDSQEVVDFYKASKAVQIPGIPELDYKRVVDGQRKIEFLKALPTTSAGRKFESRQKVIGVYDKGRPGTVLETQTVLVDVESGEVYTRVTSSGFFIGQGNWGGPKGPATENYPPPKGRAPDATIEDQTNAKSALLYRLNGDYNPLHVTPEPGEKMGFGGTIMHGLYSWNSTAHLLLKELGGGDPANIKEYQARFASPVKPGDKLVTQAWVTGEKQDEWSEVRFVTQVAGGKVVLTNGRALIRVTDQAKSKL